MQSPVRAGIEPLKDAESASSSLTIVVHDRSRSGGPSDVRPTNQALAGLRLLVAYRRDLVADETRAIARLRGALAGLFPALERSLDWSTTSTLMLVARYQTPGQIRRAGPRRVEAYLRRRGVWNAARLSAAVTEAASGETVRMLAEEAAARVVAGLASDALHLRERIAEISRSSTAGTGSLRPSCGRYCRRVR